MEILKTNCCPFLVGLLKESVEHPFIFVRIAFVLANLTMLFGTSCTYLYTAPEAYLCIKDAMLFYVDIVFLLRTTIDV